MNENVFISSRSVDYKAAREVYDYLTTCGIPCFFSDQSLLQKGESEYKQCIDKALDEATHLILVTSSAENARSKWVQYEWNSFDGELLAGRKSGNIVVALCDGMNAAQLPYALRRRQAISLPNQLEQLPNYVGGAPHIGMAPKRVTNWFSNLRRILRTYCFAPNRRMAALVIVAGISIECFRWMGSAANPEPKAVVSRSSHPTPTPEPRETPRPTPEPRKPPEILQGPATVKIRRDWAWSGSVYSTTVYVNNLEIGSVGAGGYGAFSFIPTASGENVLRLTQALIEPIGKIVKVYPGQVIEVKAGVATGWWKGRLTLDILSVTPDISNGK